jgi:hypothetical protein
MSWVHESECNVGKDLEGGCHHLFEGTVPVLGLYNECYRKDSSLVHIGPI